MEGTLTFPSLENQCASVATGHRAAFAAEIERELLACVQAAQSAVKPKILFRPARVAGDQVLVEFEVFDLDKEYDSRECSWRGQNTSQWVYAGCVLYDEESSEISSHH